MDQSTQQGQGFGAKPKAAESGGRGERYEDRLLEALEDFGQTARGCAAVFLLTWVLVAGLGAVQPGASRGLVELAALGGTLAAGGALVVFVFQALRLLITAAVARWQGDSILAAVGDARWTLRTWGALAVSGLHAAFFVLATTLVFVEPVVSPHGCGCGEMRLSTVDLEPVEDVGAEVVAAADGAIEVR